VLFVHHTNKTGAQRGTSKREDVLDTAISLSRPSDYQPGEGARFVLTFEKMRGFFGADADPLEARYEVENGAARWTFGDPIDDQLEKAKQLFDDGLTVRAVAELMGISKSAAGHLRRCASTTAAISEADACPDVPRA